MLFSVDLGTPVNKAVDWLTENLSGLFDAVTTVMTELVNAVLYVLTAPHMVVIIAVFTILAFFARGWFFALYTLGAFLLIQGMGLWTPAMQTLAVVVVASVFAVVIGVPIGIWAARSPLVSALVRPVLDFLQTLPVFVYLIPAVFFFGIGLVPGVVATILFAISPAVRLTELGIRQVDREVVEAAHAFGARNGQILRGVQLPLALPSIMAGINQVIMLALSMVVIAGMVGADGLGTIVVRGISQLDVGIGFQGGLAVVFLAIFLDRTTSALATPRIRRWPGRGRTGKTPVADTEKSSSPASSTTPVSA
ncbi:proline/glycine betaine ABC transporter permease [Streptomyces sp. NBC_00006]|uniref:ABC transporter permease n=1 Tax=unclassified Streptomyces TaxID=2593676 RepID=UPI002256C92A|nr:MULTISPECIES: proline/glycine betaine ABC transporter permease [unclassified Streptomyces]MCX4835130.1 proline/glycine betaine ABC transporter permease [Streptomyces sp. NBC_01016]MCX5537659.1 proline/glycine betaine ABC transporter permease [Streptomyces sp. NBC_00006]